MARSARCFGEPRSATAVPAPASNAPRTRNSMCTPALRDAHRPLPAPAGQGCRRTAWDGRLYCASTRASLASDAACPWPEGLPHPGPAFLLLGMPCMAAPTDFMRRTSARRPRRADGRPTSGRASRSAPKDATRAPSCPLSRHLEYLSLMPSRFGGTLPTIRPSSVPPSGGN